MKKRLNIVVYTFCYNDIELLPFVIDYWKLYATKVIVYDNGSTDGSIELLLKYDWIEIRSYDTDGKFDPIKILEIKNKCYEECIGTSVDYVMICDIDEVLLYGNKLMDKLVSLKMAGVNIIEADYYDLLRVDFPKYEEDHLILSYDGIKPSKLNIDKLALFDPNLIIELTSFCTNYLVKKTCDILAYKLPMIHLKMVGLYRFYAKQKAMYELTTYGLSYGNSKDSTAKYFNFKNALWYKNRIRLENIATNDIGSYDYEELKKIEENKKQQAILKINASQLIVKNNIEKPIIVNNKILICIFNYRHDENAKRWLHLLSPYFKTIVLDSGNDHEEKEFILFPNIFYSGLWNEMKKLSELGDYKWIGQICSDVEIDDENIDKLILQLNKLILTDIGIYLPAAIESSRKGWATLINRKFKFTSTNIIEGWMCIIHKDVMDNIDYIDTNINLYGYGIDIVASKTAIKLKKLIIIDNLVLVYNPAGTGYNINLAHIQGDIYTKSILGKTLLQALSEYKVEYTNDDLLELSKIKQEEFIHPYDNNILICIFNYRHDENAKRLLHLLSPNFKTVVLDSGNDHKEPEFIQYPNIYYSGLWNEMKKLSEQGNYKWVGIITSDVEIDDVNIFKLCERIKTLQIIKNIGVWQPSASKEGKSCYGYNNGSNSMEPVNLLEGWFLMINSFVLNKLPLIDVSINLYGWQIDNVICTISKKLCNMLNIKDNSIQVYHPSDSGYNQDDARKQGRRYAELMEKTLGILISKFKDKIENKKIIYNNWYNCEEINYDGNKEHPIFVSLTSWHKRILYVEESLIAIKKLTMKPDKIIVWLSSDEFSLYNIPNELLNDKDIDLKFVDKNLSVWKRYLTMQQYPNAYIVTMDDDLVYHYDYIEKLYNEAIKHNSYGIISYGSLYCTKFGTPYVNRVNPMDEKIPWIAGGISMWCPYSFPIESLYYYKNTMYGRKFLCDETYLMCFIRAFNIPIYNVVDNRDNFLKSMKTISWKYDDAMGGMAASLKKPGKPVLLYDLLTNYLPKQYKEKYAAAFSNYGEDVCIENINEYKDLIKTNKLCIYTCISGNYDILRTPNARSNGWDYICFTDQNIKSDFWEIRELPDDLKKYSQVKRLRLLKILSHKYLPEYDQVIWIDANVVLINENIDDYVSRVLINNNISFKLHPHRDCIYDECDACVKYKKENIDNVNKLKTKYHNEGMPEHYGMFETNIFIRNHNNVDVQTLMNMWADELINNSHRDLLSLNYCIWKLNMKNKIDTYNIDIAKQFFIQEPHK